MRLHWEFGSDDIRRVQEFVAAWWDDPLVAERRNRNLAEVKSPTTREKFWTVLTACLLTSVQRSGPDSPVTRFLCLDPFPLHIDVCDAAADLASVAQPVLQRFGGIRFTTKIPRWLADNLPLMSGEGWQLCAEQLEYLRQNQTLEAERSVAQFFDDRFWGLGPKQARNLLQILGLTRFEIPLDSRVVKWLKQVGFDAPLSADLLAFTDYYTFVEDGVRALCDACGFFPCVLDAAVFASFDRGRWTPELAVW